MVKNFTKSFQLPINNKGSFQLNGLSTVLQITRLLTYGSNPASVVPFMPDYLTDRTDVIFNGLFFLRMQMAKAQ